MSHSNECTLLEYLLPEGLLDYFKLSKVDLINGVFNIHLHEINQVPMEYSKDKLSSKDFFEEIKIQDFPIRGKAAFLHV